MIEIDAHQLTKIQGKLASFKIISAEVIKEDVRQLLANQARANFASESDNGAAWERLGFSTQKDRKRKGYNPTDPILVRTGALRKAATDDLRATVQNNNNLIFDIADERLARIAGFASITRPILRVNTTLSKAIAEIYAKAQFEATRQIFNAD